MEEKKKEPILVKDLLDKSSSEDANRELLKIEVEYNREKQDFENRYLERNGIIFDGKNRGNLTHADGVRDLDIQKESFRMLKDKYLGKAEETYDKYHPESVVDKLSESEKADRELYTKGYNHGFELKAHEPELASKLQENLRDIETPYAKGNKDGNMQCSREELTSKLQERSKEKSRDNIQEKEKNPNFDKKQDLPRDRDI